MPARPEYDCIACSDTGKNSRGGDCIPCLKKGKIKPSIAQPVQNVRPVKKLIGKSLLRKK